MTPTESQEHIALKFPGLFSDTCFQTKDGGLNKPMGPEKSPVAFGQANAHADTIRMEKDFDMRQVRLASQKAND